MTCEICGKAWREADSSRDIVSENHALSRLSFLRQRSVRLGFLWGIVQLASLEVSVLLDPNVFFEPPAGGLVTRLPPLGVVFELSFVLVVTFAMGYHWLGTREALNAQFIATLVTWIPVSLISAISFASSPFSSAIGVFILGLYVVVFFWAGVIAIGFGSALRIWRDEFGRPEVPLEEQIRRVQGLGDSELIDEYDALRKRLQSRASFEPLDPDILAAMDAELTRRGITVSQSTDEE